MELSKLTLDERRERAEKLCEIKAKIQTLVDKAFRLLQGTGRTLKRSEAYWLTHIEGALDNERDFIGGSVYTMQHAIDELILNEDKSRL